MKLRLAAVPWTLGALGIISLAAVACGSAAASDDDVVLSQSAAASSQTVATDTVDATESEVWIGVATASVPELLAELLGVPAGERVAWVTSGGPADGILILGDTIVALDGDAIDSDGGLNARLALRATGESVSLSILRGGDSLDVQITLAARPAHESADGLAEIQGLFDSALSGELRFLDREGGEHSAAFVSGTISGVNEGLVTLTQPGSGPATLTLSPNVFVWIDGAPGTVADLADVTGGQAKVVTFDDTAVAVLAGGIIPPALEALESLFGEGGNGLIEALGALEMLQGLFGASDAPAPDAGL